MEAASKVKERPCNINLTSVCFRGGKLTCKRKKKQEDNAHIRDTNSNSISDAEAREQKGLWGHAALKPRQGARDHGN
jgi:hypothetical protein